MIDQVVTALVDRPKVAALIVAVDVNTDLGDAENYRRGS